MSYNIDLNPFFDDSKQQRSSGSKPTEVQELRNEIVQLKNELQELQNNLKPKCQRCGQADCTLPSGQSGCY